MGPTRRRCARQAPKKGEMAEDKTGANGHIPKVPSTNKGGKTLFVLFVVLWGRGGSRWRMPTLSIFAISRGRGDFIFPGKEEHKLQKPGGTHGHNPGVQRGERAGWRH